jgi:serine/threonine protein kinase
MTATAQFDVCYAIDGRYTVEKILGTGAFGTVYLCDDTELGRAVAVKVLHNVSLVELGEEARQRFFREAKALSQLKHKYIINVHRIGLLDSGQPFLVMEYVSGKPLAQEITEKGSFYFKEAIARALQIAEALHHAHLKGIIHRDVKPDNVLVVDSGGQASIKLLDFGLSALLQEGDKERSQLTRTGSIIGTPLYVSPEVFKGHAADARSDIYSLGCVTFEMIAGNPPFPADDIAEAMVNHLNQPIPDLQQLDPQAKLPSALQPFLNKATAKEREARYGNMQEVIDELRLLLQIDSEAKFHPQQFRHGPRSGLVPAKKPIIAHLITLSVAISIALAISIVATISFAWANPEQFTDAAGGVLPPATMVRLLPFAASLMMQTRGLHSAEAFAAKTLRAPLVHSWSPQERLALACSYGRQFQSDNDATSRWPFLIEMLQDSLQCVYLRLPPSSEKDDATVGDAIEFLRGKDLTRDQWIGLLRMLDANYHSSTSMKKVWERSITGERLDRLYEDASDHEGAYHGQLAERNQKLLEHYLSEARESEYDADPAKFVTYVWEALKLATQCKMDKYVIIARQMKVKYYMRRKDWKDAWDDFHELDVMDRKAFTDELWAEHEQIKEQLRPYAGQFSH